LHKIVDINKFINIKFKPQMNDQGQTFEVNAGDLNHKTRGKSTLVLRYYHSVNLFKTIHRKALSSNLILLTLTFCPASAGLILIGLIRV